MAHDARRAHVALKLLATVVIMIWSSTTQGNIFGATAMTLDQAILAAASTSSQGTVSHSMAMLQSHAAAVRVQQSQPQVVRVELDMLFRTQDLAAMKRTRRSAMRDEKLRWPNGEIPYQLSLHLTDADLRSFNAALEEYHKFTCLRFRQRTSTDESYVNIVSDVGCYSYVGRLMSDYQPQKLSLAAGCLYKNVIIHEFAHAIGLHHEQTRPDRDDFVTIRNESIEESKRHNFDKYTTGMVDSRGIPYDYLSVMHYGAKFLTMNGQDTIVTKNPAYQGIIGNAPGFSFRDVKLVNAIYSCSEKNRCRKKECPSEGFVGQDCQCWCPSGNNGIAAVRCPGCHDFNEYCHYFMERGMCNIRLFANYMKDVCPRACRVCT